MKYVKLWKLCCGGCLFALGGCGALGTTLATSAESALTQALSDAVGLAIGELVGTLLPFGAM